MGIRDDLRDLFDDSAHEEELENNFQKEIKIDSREIPEDILAIVMRIPPIILGNYFFDYGAEDNVRVEMGQMIARFPVVDRDGDILQPTGGKSVEYSWSGMLWSSSEGKALADLDLLRDMVDLGEPVTLWIFGKRIRVLIEDFQAEIHAKCYIKYDVKVIEYIPQRIKAIGIRTDPINPDRWGSDPDDPTRKQSCSCQIYAVPRFSQDPAGLTPQQRRFFTLKFGDGTQYSFGSSLLASFAEGFAKRWWMNVFGAGKDPSNRFLVTIGFLENAIHRKLIEHGIFECLMQYLQECPEMASEMFESMMLALLESSVRLVINRPDVAISRIFSYNDLGEIGFVLNSYSNMMRQVDDKFRDWLPSADFSDCDQRRDQTPSDRFFLWLHCVKQSLGAESCSDFIRILREMYGSDLENVSDGYLLQQCELYSRLQASMLGGAPSTYSGQMDLNELLFHATEVRVYDFELIISKECWDWCENNSGNFQTNQKASDYWRDQRDIYWRNVPEAQPKPEPPGVQPNPEPPGEEITPMPEVDIEDPQPPVVEKIDPEEEEESKSEDCETPPVNVAINNSKWIFKADMQQGVMGAWLYGFTSREACEKAQWNSKDSDGTRVGRAYLTSAPYEAELTESGNFTCYKAFVTSKKKCKDGWSKMITSSTSCRCSETGDEKGGGEKECPKPDLKITSTELYVTISAIQLFYDIRYMYQVRFYSSLEDCLNDEPMSTSSSGFDYQAEKGYMHHVLNVPVGATYYKAVARAYTHCGDSQSEIVELITDCVEID